MRNNRQNIWIRLIAQGIELVWSGFWVFFGIASGIGEGNGLTATIIHTIRPGLILAASAIIAIKWELVG